MKQGIFLRFDRALPYFSALYFLEIGYLMVALMFMSGKAVAVAAAGVLSLLLALHIFMLYFKRPAGRLVQLVLMDVHCAYSVPFAFTLAFHEPGLPVMDTAFMLLRVAMAAAELAFIFALTDEQVRRSYS